MNIRNNSITVLYSLTFAVKQNWIFLLSFTKENTLNQLHGSRILFSIGISADLKKKLKWAKAFSAKVGCTNQQVSYLL